jgi:transposase
MTPTAAARERAMRVREVILRTMKGEYSWIQASEILGLSPRTLRRWRYKFRTHGVDGLLDRRRVRRSPRAVCEAEMKRWFQLYRRRDRGYNARHFYAVLKRRHGCRWSYSMVLRALQGAGLVRKHRPRGRHFVRREPRPGFGELLHIDGSLHRWLTRCPEQCQSLIAVVDDATKRLLYARLVEHESTHAILTASAFSPPITTSSGTHRPIRSLASLRCTASTWMPSSVSRRCAPYSATTAVTLEGVRLQIAKQPGRATCAGLSVTLRRHLDGTHSVWWGTKLLGRYGAQGRTLSREPLVHPTPSASAVAVA